MNLFPRESRAEGGCELGVLAVKNFQTQSFTAVGCRILYNVSNTVWGKFIAERNSRLCCIWSEKYTKYTVTTTGFRKQA